MKFDHTHAGVGESDIREHAKKLEPYRRYLEQVAEEGGYMREEGSINLPYDKSIENAIAELSQKKSRERLKYVVVVGIGGSNLGTKAVHDGLSSRLSVDNDGRFPRILFLDTASTSVLNGITSMLKGAAGLEEILICLISKSGETTETILNIELLFTALKERFGEEEIKGRIVAITDVDSKLWIQAEEEEINRLGIPQLVGGRFSIFSAVGLFPLALSGIDVSSLLKGAKSMREKCLLEVEENPAMQSAVVLYSHKGRGIHNTFFFNTELDSLGKWYRQLLGESIGKERDRDGNTVNTGITPIISIGSTDLHSMGQLYLGGPRDKVTTFVRAKNSQTLKVSEERLFPELVPSIEGKSTEDIMEAIFEGTKQTYVRMELPFMKVDLDDISEKEFGAFLQFKMMEVMYLGKLLNVNTFDQPQVELYKEETRKLLEE